MSRTRTDPCNRDSDSEYANADSDGTINHHLAILRLVHPPMTNREADYDRSEKELRTAFADASLYGIAQRAELAILRLEWEADTPWILSICVGVVNGTQRCSGKIDLTCFSGFTPDDFELEVGTVAPERPYWGIKVWRNRAADDFVVHLTPLRLLFWRSREMRGITGFDDYGLHLSLRLHYLGKGRNVARRLLNAGHEKRVAILSRENSIVPGASISDEVVILLFRVDTQHFVTVEPPTRPQSPPHDAVVADAEKALIHVLRPQYNEEHYERYPGGADGLAEMGLRRYAYVLADELELATSTTTFRGGDNGSMILVDGSSVRRIRC